MLRKAQRWQQTKCGDMKQMVAHERRTIMNPGWRLERRAREVGASAAELKLELGIKREEELRRTNVKFYPIWKKVKKDEEEFGSTMDNCWLTNELGSRRWGGCGWKKLPPQECETKKKGSYQETFGRGVSGAVAGQQEQSGPGLAFVQLFSRIWFFHTILLCFSSYIMPGLNSIGSDLYFQWELMCCWNTLGLTIQQIYI